ncbi:MAG: VTT domain-containing protein [Opitutales bacterium]|jgi:uncharacterized membrane protein YdjX (TVP38/TMEM64 family)
MTEKGAAEAIELTESCKPENSVDGNKKKGLLLLILLVFAAFAFLAGLYYFYLNFIGTKEDLLEYWDVFRGFLTQNSFWLFASIAILPAFIVPVAPLLALAGIWGYETDNVWLAWAFASLAVIVNLTWTYCMAAGFGRNWIERILRRTKYAVPKPSSGNELFLALILRLVPGVPFIFTNYALGLIRMPFRRYFMVSAPILSVTVGGYVLTVGGAAGLANQTSFGALRDFFLGLSIILGMIVVGRIVSRKYGRDQ